MKKRFKVGDHVTWNSEAGHVRGTIIKVHTKDVDYKGYIQSCASCGKLRDLRDANTARKWRTR